MTMVKCPLRILCSANGIAQGETKSMCLVIASLTEYIHALVHRSINRMM